MHGEARRGFVLGVLFWALGGGVKTLSIGLPGWTSGVRAYGFMGFGAWDAEVTALRVPSFGWGRFGFYCLGCRSGNDRFVSRVILT